MPDLMRHPKTTATAKHAQRPSKSQLKREARAWQKLAEALVQTPLKKRPDLLLPANIMSAVALGATLQKGAYWRHIRYIAGLLQALEVSEVNAALARVHGGEAALAAVLKRTEYRCAQLIEDSDAAISALIADYPGVDRSRLHQLVRNARRAADAGGKKASRMLYNFVRELESIQPELPRLD